MSPLLVLLPRIGYIYTILVLKMQKLQGGTANKNMDMVEIFRKSHNVHYLVYYFTKRYGCYGSSQFTPLSSFSVVVILTKWPKPNDFSFANLKIDNVPR